MKILVAEDDIISGRVLTTALVKLGHEPVLACDGEKAWAAFDQDPVRVVVSDWMMPGLDGLQLCQRIRDRPQTPYTYFIILSAAHTSTDEYSRAMATGIDDFLSKPLNRDLLRIRLTVAERILRFTTEINLLQDLIPMCSYCQKVRDGSDYWDRVDTYIRARTGAKFSHGVCPECYDEQLRMLAEETLSPAAVCTHEPALPPV